MLGFIFDIHRLLWVSADPVDVRNEPQQGTCPQAVSSSKFMLGSKGSNNAYISASGNNLEISASNFTLMSGNVTASNVDLSGKITATSGDIGGFTIDPDEIKSTNLLLDSTNEKDMDPL